jgi:hypothetical protein
MQKDHQVVIVHTHFLDHSSPAKPRTSKDSPMTKKTRTKMKIASATLALFSLALISPSGGTENRPRNEPHSQPQNSPSNDAQIDGKVVYVCACLKTKSCECMTEAKMEGPCACGTAGGPPLKPVAQNSAWAKANRQALAQ